MTANTGLIPDETAMLQAARSGDDQALNELIQLYEPEIRKIAYKYFLPRADYEDLIQEGRIAIFKAFLSYDEESTSTIPFSHFVRMVIKRKLIDSVRAHTRYKHSNLNDAYSLDNTLSEEHNESFLRVVSDTGDPAATVIALDEARRFIKNLSKELSPLEQLVFKYHYVAGFKQREVSKRLGINPKCLDNAIQRIRRKTLRCRSRQVAG